MTKKQKYKFKVNYYKLILSFIPFIIALLINKAIIYRLLLTIISSILLIITLISKNNKKQLIPLIFIIYIFFILVDAIVIYNFKRYPIFFYNIVDMGDAKVYNSPGIRVWKCDNSHNLVIEPFYMSGFECATDKMEPTNINSFSNLVVTNYNDYKNSYLKINGKISKKNGQNYIEMQPYNEDVDSLNGHVEFYDNIVLRILFRENNSLLDQYDIYDEISVMGLIKNMDNENDKYIIYMYDASLASSLDLKNYSINLTTSSKCGEKVLIHANETNDIYTYCLDDIIVAFPDNRYELSSALSSNKLNVKELYENPKKTIKSKKSETVLHQMKNYSIIVCDESISNNIIIGNKKMALNEKLCD